MQRRKFSQYLALGGASFLVNFGLLNSKPLEAFSSASLKKRQVYDWIFLYWMPYDNNLSEFGNPILGMLTKGVQSDNILVAVQSKFSGSKHLLRNLITSGNVDSQKLETTNSGSEEVFSEYLDWAKSQFQAEKWAIVFLGHGGRLDEISPDDNPIPGLNLGTKWMNIQKLSEVISNFNREVNGRVELFFFQNCNKGTIEAHYTVRHTAKYTLSSQLALGAPNYYYEPMLEFLGHHPEVDGGQLAEKIMDFERSDMYHSYTVTNNRAVRDLPEKINPLIDSVLSANIKAIKPTKLSTYSYMGDRFFDVVEFFQAITNQSNVVQHKSKEFAEFLNKSMIQKVQNDGTLLSWRRKKYQKFSGLGIFFPKSRQELENYRYLQVFSDLKLVKLFDAILFN